MRLLQSIALLASAVAAVAAKGWSFEDASVSVSEKGGSGSKETYVHFYSLSMPTTGTASY